MNKRINIIRRKEMSLAKGLLGAAFFLLPSSFFVSCSDFLEIEPMNEVVLENFWTEKADVASVVNGCYEVLESPDCIQRMGVWGELRSDNIWVGSNVPNDINELLKENLLSSNSYCNWSKFYDCINRCNTVIHYAPEVQQIDPNYSEEELRANLAEVTTLRALCYFYLIRTFRDVPYVTEPSIDDTQDYVVAATPFDQVLDALIADLERIKGDAVRRYEVERCEGNVVYLSEKNSSRITRWTVYTLLADLYLWKGDWDNCIKCCDAVLAYKREQYEEMLKRVGTFGNLALFHGIPLILEKTAGSTTCGNAYTEIFGSGNSFESIFELYFRTNQTQKNTWVANFYGDSRNTMGSLSAASFLAKDASSGKNEVFKKTDSRVYESTQGSNSNYAISKYTRTSVSFTISTSMSKDEDLKLSSTRRTTDYANWILYRMSDVILMKAEAMIEKGTDFDGAFHLINTINKRANDITTTSRSDSLKLADYNTSKANMEELLLAERQREFLFEGKRWFDLVRFARRDGNNTRLISLATRKYIENVNAIKIKLADPNIVYFPYAKSELKVNPLLKQNPAYGNEEDSQLTK